jgi:hypothetical protein
MVDCYFCYFRGTKKKARSLTIRVQQAIGDRGPTEGRPQEAPQGPSEAPCCCPLDTINRNIAYQGAPEPCWKHGPGTCHPH